MPKSATKHLITFIIVYIAVMLWLMTLALSQAYLAFCAGIFTLFAIPIIGAFYE